MAERLRHRRPGALAALRQRPTVACAAALPLLLLLAVACGAAPAPARADQPPGDSSPFANPPLLYDGGDSSDGYWPYSGPAPTSADPRSSTPRRTVRGMLLPGAAPVGSGVELGGGAAKPRGSLASRDTELPSRLPQDDRPDGLPRIEPDLADDERLLDGPQLSDFKNGFFQKLSFSETYLPRWGAGGFGVNEVETFVTVAAPLPTRDWPVLITPYFQWRTLDGPDTLDLPANLYETYLDFMWVPRFNPSWTGILAVAPSLYSDFESSLQDGFRLTGKGLVRWDAVPEKLQVIAGVLYLNRERITWLPAGGLIWDPNPDVHYELLFPRPQLAHRIGYGNDWENWLYVAGEFGGNSFEVTRSDGSPDVLLLYDLRVSVGFEHKRPGGAGARVELGYVFDRRIEYFHPSQEVAPDPTAMLRGVITF